MEGFQSTAVAIRLRPLIFSVEQQTAKLLDFIFKNCFVIQIIKYEGPSHQSTEFFQAFPRVVLNLWSQRWTEFYYCLTEAISFHGVPIF